MNLAWLTDVHLNFLETDERENFFDEILETQCFAVLISGDIAEASSLSEILQEMSTHINKPIYFVLGNHDYYFGGVSEVRHEVSDLTKSEKLLFWLPTSGPQVLTSDTILLGQDGWADGRYGDYMNSRVVLNDSRLIAELSQFFILFSISLFYIPLCCLLSLHGNVAIPQNFGFRSFLFMS